MAQNTAPATEAGTQNVTAQPADATTDFTLSASEGELLEEFGVLLAAEYNYATAI